MDINEKINRVKRIAIIAGVFTTVVSLLMLLNYLPSLQEFLLQW